MSDNVTMFADDLFESWTTTSREDLDKVLDLISRTFASAVQKDADHVVPQRMCGYKVALSSHTTNTKAGVYLKVPTSCTDPAGTHSL